VSYKIGNVNLNYFLILRTITSNLSMLLKILIRNNNCFFLVLKEIKMLGIIVDVTYK